MICLLSSSYSWQQAIQNVCEVWLEPITIRIHLALAPLPSCFKLELRLVIATVFQLARLVPYLYQNYNAQKVDACKRGCYTQVQPNKDQGPRQGHQLTTGVRCIKLVCCSCQKQLGLEM